MSIYSKGFKPVLDFSHLVVQMRTDQCLSCSMQSVHPPVTPGELPSWLTWVTLFLGVSRAEGDQDYNHMASVAPRALWGSSPFPYQDLLSTSERSCSQNSS